MKAIILSDIHGSYSALQSILHHYDDESIDYLILVGDYLNHGPRNPLPTDYDPQKVTHILNQLNTRIIAVRGNCDSEVDQMLLKFPMMSDYHCLYDRQNIFITHGHLYHPENHPFLEENDVFISGHTHIPSIERKQNIFYLNPGSISIPKGNHPPTYGVITESTFKILTLEHQIYLMEERNV